MGFFRMLVGCSVLSVIMTGSSAHADVKLSTLLHVFADLPEAGLFQTPGFPTPNEALTDDSVTGFAARSRTNEEYGLPGWTRSLGSRFHKGVDILPTQFEKTTNTVRIDYYDPKTKRDFSRNEPVLVPKDPVFTILDGIVVVANTNERRSGYGRYAMIEHRFTDGSTFISMYAHLNRLLVNVGDTVRRGDQIGWMGQTSSSRGGRTYLKAIPHCHFEVGRVINPDFASTSTARNLYPKTIGGKYDPRNIQPFHPIQFLRHFRAHAGGAPSLASHTKPLSREN